MKTLLGVAAAAALLAGCTEMRQFYPDASVVPVDGEEFVVRPVKGENAFHAVPNHVTNYGVLSVTPAASAKNVRAIEAFTGCVVMRESIQHRELHTFATVRC